MSGMLLALEGIDGAGKTEQAALLVEWLAAQGHAVIATREPGGTPFGRALRDVLRSKTPRVPLAELLVFLADHREHLERVVWPSLDAGCVVVSDRWSDSARIYQQVLGGLGEQEIADLAVRVGRFTVPRLTLLLDVDAATAWERLERRDGRQPVDPWQRGADVLARLRAAYLDRARLHRRRWVVVDAGGAVGQVAAAIREAVRPLLTRPLQTAVEEGRHG